MAITGTESRFQDSRLRAEVLAIGGTDVTATAAEINRAADVSARGVAVTAATVTITEAAHEGRVVVLNRAAGIAVTLPAATGSMGIYRFLIGATVTSNTTTIKVVGDDTMKGLALQLADGGNTLAGYETAADTDTITLNGTTTGGLIGDAVELIDIAADTWFVRVTGAATGAEASPFSATVS